MQFTLNNGWKLRRGKHLAGDVKLYAALLCYTKEALNVPLHKTN